MLPRIKPLICQLGLRHPGKEAGEAAPAELPGVAPPTTQDTSPLPSPLGAQHLLNTDCYRCSLWSGKTQEQREVRRLEDQNVCSQKTCHLLAVFFSKPSAGPSSVSLSTPVKWEQPPGRKQVSLTHCREDLVNCGTFLQGIYKVSLK